MSDSVKCSHCDQVFTDEESLNLHKDVDHGVEETDQKQLHRQHIPRGNLSFPTETEPEDEDQGVPTTGAQGYNPNPNAGLYDNKLFRVGSSTERTSILGEAEFGNFKADEFTTDYDESTYTCQTCGKQFKGNYEAMDHLLDTKGYHTVKHGESYANEFDGDEFQKYSDAKNKFENRSCRKCGERELIIVSKDSVDYDESGEPIHAVVQCANCDTKYGVESKASEDVTFGHQYLADNRKYYDKCEICGKPSIDHYGWTALGQDEKDHSFVDQGLSDGMDVDFGRALGGTSWHERNLGESEDKKKKREADFIDDDGNMYDFEIRGESDVDYEKENEQSMGFIEQQHTEPPKDENKELDDVDISEEKIDYIYKTKSSEAKEKSYVTEAIDGLDEEYDDFEDSDEEEVQQKVTEGKLGGFSDESIARELHIIYGVSHDEALEKVQSIEVSTNDKVANTFFGKMYKDCTESEKTELRMYSGSD